VPYKLHAFIVTDLSLFQSLFQTYNLELVYIIQFNYIQYSLFIFKNTRILSLVAVQFLLPAQRSHHNEKTVQLKQVKIETKVWYEAFPLPVTQYNELEPELLKRLNVNVSKPGITVFINIGP